LAQDELTSKSINRPNPRVIMARPNQIKGRYFPVFLMKMPVKMDMKESATACGSRYTPERMGVAPRTAWKYSGR
jgi:hypothetical protein